MENENVQQPKKCKRCNQEAELIWTYDGITKHTRGFQGMKFVTTGVFVPGDYCYWHGKVQKGLCQSPF